MERDTNQMSQSGALCRSGCGFYGSPATDGLCSKCYKDALKRKQTTPGTNIPGRSSPTENENDHISRYSGEAFNSPEKRRPSFSKGLLLLQASGSSESASTTLPVSDSSLNTASPTIPPVIASTSQDASTSEKNDGNPGEASATNSRSTESVGSDSGSQQDDSKQNEQKKKKNRCLICRKKLGLTGFQCRCGGLFCSIHRYSNEHNCTFDYKQLGAQEIRKNNPLVVGDKIQKI